MISELSCNNKSKRIMEDQIERSLNDIPIPKSSVEYIDVESTEISNIANQSDEVSWLSCAGQFENIISNLVECKVILKKMKTDPSPNPIVFLLESWQIINNIYSKCELFLKTSGVISNNISEHSKEIPDHKSGILLNMIQVKVV
nr:uncharacterized protein LOC124814591 [Hydra vulgaris]